MNASVWAGTKLVLAKEFRQGIRFKAAWAAMLMFALTTLSCVSLALQGAALSPKVAAALLWVILFFASMVGADRVFLDEEAARTLLALRVYGGSQPVLFGKMLYTYLVLLAMGLFILPLFLMLLAENVAEPLLLLLTTSLGLLGVAAAGTLVAALTIGSAVHGGLFSILMLPVILPVFLPAISLTAGALGGEAGSLSYFGGLALYDMILMVGASLLFDYLWYEE